MEKEIKENPENFDDGLTQVMPKGFNFKRALSELGKEHINPLVYVKILTLFDEFIRLLKEELCKEMIERKHLNHAQYDRISQEKIWLEIDKLAGSDLI